MRQLPHPDLQDVALDRVLAALADPVRLEIIRSLDDGTEHPRAEYDYGLAPSTVSHHIRTLVDAGLINTRREATRCWVSARTEIDAHFPGLLASVLAQPARGGRL